MSAPILGPLEQPAAQILARMPGELVLGELFLLSPHERRWLRLRKPVSQQVLWECLASLIVERRRRYGSVRGDAAGG